MDSSFETLVEQQASVMALEAQQAAAAQSSIADRLAQEHATENTRQSVDHQNLSLVTNELHMVMGALRSARVKPDTVLEVPGGSALFAGMNPGRGATYKKIKGWNMITHAWQQKWRDDAEGTEGVGSHTLTLVLSRRGKIYETKGGPGYEVKLKGTEPMWYFPDQPPLGLELVRTGLARLMVKARAR